MKLVKSTIKSKKYYYLEHSYRYNNKVKKARKYLGSIIPDNLEEIKAGLMEFINRKKWYDELDRIKKNFSNEFKKLPKKAREKYLENFLIKFTYNTNRIEGSTLTLKETARLLEDGITPRNKPIKDVKEAEAHKAVFEELIKEKDDLSLKLVLEWHKKLFENVDMEIAGRIRKHPVAIAGSKFEPPMSIELNYLLREFFQWYKNHKNKLHSVELAALVHLKFVTIHPFTDGNGRISRLMMNFVMQRNGYPMPDIQYSNRNSYYNALERSQTKEKERIFVQYLIKRYLKEYKKYT
ncbi:MAG: Fic family protein [Nanoarchaeota archaeon]|nr:Fic family protein [Nanoarchaeota archaeon]MBU1321619.1 Fic family protein [Nanoarchaeota archaeon]MBU1597986.1 Fic family protein [Nanoarchaeota archaeon]MBU2440937.1 Fic family protein [Nanoarchaeota archaeon]